MIPDLTVSRSIAAPAEAVFAAITDITRMGEWSPECVRAEWSDGFSGPATGARFIGHNVNGDKEWSIESTIVELVENERFFFDCISSVTPDFVFARWGYSIEPAETGCTVTEYWQDLRPEFMLERSALASGVSDRPAHNQAGMELTLERLAAAVEQQ
ncbi:MAG: SRPBCC family protein [Actinomycetota bacterium]